MRPFLLVDAFTDRALAGNPCAVVLDAEGLDDAQMQRLAQEFNQSETVFVSTPGGGPGEPAFALRFFTPGEEIPMAGHPTISAITALLHAGRLALGPERQSLAVQLLHGPITIDIEAPPAPGALPRIGMTQRQPVFGAEHDPAQVMPLFGLTPDDLFPGARIQTVSTGSPQLMVMLRDAEALRRAHPPEPLAYSRYRAASDFFSPDLFCLGGATPAGRTFARHFGVPPDIVEDPVTGSATGGMAAYLWKYGHLDSPRFLAEQGHGLGRPGHVEVEVIGPRDAIEAVRISGTGVVVVEGRLRL